MIVPILCVVVLVALAIIDLCPPGALPTWIVDDADDE